MAQAQAQADADAVWKWTYHVGTVTREEIAWAIADENWQAFRMSLKGLPTEVKLARLKSWYETTLQLRDTDPTATEQRDWRKMRVQTWNYLNALKRGGQLNAIYEVVR